MNSNQRLYDLAFITINNSITKINPFDYYKNLKTIYSRRTQFPSFDKFSYKRVNPKLIPYKDHFVIESNKKYSSKIKSLIKKPIIPKINSEFEELDQRLKNNNERNRFVKSRALKLENKKFKMRVKDQKPKLLKASHLSKLFIENHSKYSENFLRNSRFKKKPVKKREPKQHLSLPSISGSEFNYKSIRIKSEYNLDSNDSSKDNSLEQKDHKHHEFSHEKQGDNEDGN
jgi:hypothetical protein